MTTFYQAFESLKDSRMERNKKHKLLDCRENH
jgi:hypothetical protein